MNIKEEAAKLRKKIEKLNWQLMSGFALSQKERDQKEDNIDESKKECEGLKPPLESFSQIDHAVIVMSNNY